MRSGTIAFLLGVVGFQLLPELPHPGWTLALAAALPLAWRLRSSRRSLTVAGALSAGFLIAWGHAASVLADPLPAEAVGRDLIVWGSIEGLPLEDARRVRFLFRPDRLEMAGKPVAPPGLLRLSWYGRHPPVTPGDRWRLVIRLKRPRGLFNPGSFDYERWLFQNGIRATGYVRSSPLNRHLGQHGGLDALRAELADAIARHLGNRPATSLIQALVVGDRRAITREQWDVLAATGTTHLMAISGLHIGLVAGLVFVATRRLWAWGGRLTLRWPAPRAAAVLAGFAALGYAALAGFSVPTQRALVMSAVALLALASGRRVPPSRTLAMALLCVLLLDPLAVLSAGFWLSFGAVAVILYGMAGRLRPANGWRVWLRVQGLVALGIAPLLMVLFGAVSLVAPLVNLGAVPWVGMIVVPLALAGTLLLTLSDTLGGLLLEGARAALALPWPLLEAAAYDGMVEGWAPPWTLPFAGLGIAWLLAPRGVPARWIGCFGLLPMLLFSPTGPEPGRARVALLDVGQGLSVVIETANHVLVYDTGPRFSARFDAGSAVVVPYLRYRGIDRVDILVASHGDGDHVGGLPAVRDAVAIGRLLRPTADPVGDRCSAGQRWRWDRVEFAILHPQGEEQGSENDNSCVLSIRAGSHRLLIPGDIEASAEERLLARAVPLDSDILVAPHHGSRTSSVPAFVSAVSPDWLLVSVGADNRWNFPDPEVIKRYRNVGARVLTTAQGGPILLELGGESLQPTAYRRYARRYWHQ